MKIALVGVVEFPVEKNATGGTEIWTYNLAEELSKRGHEVTLFSCKESECSGKVESICSYKDVAGALTGASDRNKNIVFSNLTMLDLVKKQDQFDLIHLSVSNPFFCLAFEKLLKKPFVVTFHSALLPKEDMEVIFKTFSDAYYVFISNNFASAWPKPNKSRVIYNGINVEDFKFSADKGESCFWLGRITPEKGALEAAQAAKKAGVKLRLGGSVRDEEYFEKQVKPLIGADIEYLGELGFEDKIGQYQNALAYLVPIKWEEPFGLTIVEAMACGTPVIAFERGSLNELIKEGENGFLIEPDNVDQMAQTIKKISELSDEDYLAMRKNARAQVEEKFTLERMVDDYEALYREIINS